MRCRKCGNDFPSWDIVNGKRRSFTQRKYCLDCSPFGSRNTRKLETPKVTTCQACGRPKRGRSYCAVCAVDRHRKKRLELLYSIVGFKCWVCGYGGDVCYIPLLNMHHVNPNDKSFELNGRGMQRTLKIVYAEMRKCVLACVRCHREVHHDLLDRNKIEKIRIREWKRRKAAPNGKGPVC